jgi:hypothetical protein
MLRNSPSAVQQGGRRMVQEGALTALASVADCAQVSAQHRLKIEESGRFRSIPARLPHTSEVE